MYCDSTHINPPQLSPMDLTGAGLMSFNLPVRVHVFLVGMLYQSNALWTVLYPAITFAARVWLYACCTVHIIYIFMWPHCLQIWNLLCHFASVPFVYFSYLWCFQSFSDIPDPPHVWLREFCAPVTGWFFCYLHHVWALTFIANNQNQMVYNDFWNIYVHINYFEPVKFYFFFKTDRLNK